MDTDEKLALIERVLGAEEDTLAGDTPLADVPEWDSLAAMNLQIELTRHWPDISLDALHDCRTAGDICALCQ